MTSKPLSVLITLNVVLLAVLVLLTLTPKAPAQPFGGAGNYLMISGNAQGRSSQSAVYIVELNTARMITVFFNSANNEFEAIAATDIGQDTERAAAGR